MEEGGAIGDLELATLVEVARESPADTSRWSELLLAFQRAGRELEGLHHVGYLVWSTGGSPELRSAYYQLVHRHLGLLGDPRYRLEGRSGKPFPRPVPGAAVLEYGGDEPRLVLFFPELFLPGTEIPLPRRRALLRFSSDGRHLLLVERERAPAFGCGTFVVRSLETRTGKTVGRVDIGYEKPTMATRVEDAHPELLEVQLRNADDEVMHAALESRDETMAELLARALRGPAPWHVPADELPPGPRIERTLSSYSIIVPGHEHRPLGPFGGAAAVQTLGGRPPWPLVLVGAGRALNVHDARDGSLRAELPRPSGRAVLDADGSLYLAEEAVVLRYPLEHLGSSGEEVARDSSQRTHLTNPLWLVAVQEGGAHFVMKDRRGVHLLRRGEQATERLELEGDIGHRDPSAGVLLQELGAPPGPRGAPEPPPPSGPRAGFLADGAHLYVYFQPWTTRQTNDDYAPLPHTLDLYRIDGERVGRWSWFGLDPIQVVQHPREPEVYLVGAWDILAFRPGLPRPARYFLDGPVGTRGLPPGLRPGERLLFSWDAAWIAQVGAPGLRFRDPDGEVLGDPVPLLRGETTKFALAGHNEILLQADDAMVHLQELPAHLHSEGPPEPSREGSGEHPLTGEAVFYLAALEVFRDGVVDAEENHMLQGLQQTLGLSSTQAVELARLARSRVRPEEAVGASPARPGAILAAACRAACADGVIEPAERALLVDLARALGLSEDVLEELFHPTTG